MSVSTSVTSLSAVTPASLYTVGRTVVVNGDTTTTTTRNADGSLTVDVAQGTSRHPQPPI